MRALNIRKRKMELALENLQKKIALNPPRILNVVKTILRHEGVTHASLSIVFVTRQRITALNNRFLRRHYATDVLAFDLREFQPNASRIPKEAKRKTISGDIIISTDAAIKNARIYGTGIAHELVLYIIHGILHLLGYGDYKQKDVRKMRKKEIELLEYLEARVEKVLKIKKRSNAK